jgi:hypothetical protein
MCKQSKQEYYIPKVKASFHCNNIIKSVHPEGKWAGE